MLAAQRYPYGPQDFLGRSPYQVVRVVGVGGSSIIYEAEDTSCGRRVVLKVLRPDVAQRARFTAAHMEREARLLVALARETEHVIDVVTAGVTDDAHRLPYYVMELLQGHTLRVALDRKASLHTPLAIDEALGIAVDLGVALEHAHRLGITHLDLKPENAFVHKKRDGALVMKLLDFGISATIDETLGTFRGTYRYAAPEQVRGQRVSPATDLYALGLVTFEVLALRRPFDVQGEPTTNEALARAHCELPAPNVSSFRPDVPPALADLVAQCLLKEPGQRPPSAPYLVGRLREIRREFERGLAGTLGTRSHLATLTLLDPPQFTLVDNSLRPRGATAEPAAEPAPRSEVFVTAQPGVAALAGPSGPSTTSIAVPPSNRAVVLAVAAGVLAAFGVAIAGFLLLTRSPPQASVADRTPSNQGPTPPAVSTARAAASAAEPAPASAPVVQPPPALSAAVLSVPAHSASPGGHAGAAVPPTVRGSASGRATEQDGGTAPSAPNGITTKKDWF